MALDHGIEQLIKQSCFENRDPSLNVFEDPATRELAIEYLARFRARMLVAGESGQLTPEKRDKAQNLYYELAKSTIESGETFIECDEEDLAQAVGLPQRGTIEYLNQRN